jgi:hypothetical protein
LIQIDTLHHKKRKKTGTWAGTAIDIYTIKDATATQISALAMLGFDS